MWVHSRNVQALQNSSNITKKKPARRHLQKNAQTTEDLEDLTCPAKGWKFSLFFLFYTVRRLQEATARFSVIKGQYCPADSIDSSPWLKLNKWTEADRVDTQVVLLTLFTRFDQKPPAHPVQGYPVRLPGESGPDWKFFRHGRYHYPVPNLLLEDCWLVSEKNRPQYKSFVLTAECRYLVLSTRATQHQYCWHLGL